MAQVELIMPKMGESIMEATILKWLKQPGDTIEIDEAVLEIATDKVDSEVPSPVAGVLNKTLFEEGDTVEIGKAVAIIATEGEEVGIDSGNGMAAQTEPTASEPASSTPEPVSEPVSQPSIPDPGPGSGPTQPEPAFAPAASAGVDAAVATASAPQGNGKSRFYSPLVMNIARQEGISMVELEAVPGTGKEGRVTKKDILNYVSQRKPGVHTSSTSTAGAAAVAQEASAPAASAPASAETGTAIQTAEPVASSPAPSVSGRVEIVEMDRMRKLIAKHMVMSKSTSAHVTSFVEADMTSVVQWRKRVKNAFMDRYGEKITYTPIMIEAIVKAIKDFPMINISIDGDNLLVKKDINIGMAAALPSGNLIVPVIKHADQYNLAGLTRQVNDLANRARQGKLKPDEIEGGTYTMSNVGTFGNVMGTPIINQPQVAIMATGAIRKKPAVIETPQGDFIGIRHMMFLSHSYDHRVVDGFLGGSFVRKVADYLEQFDINREI